jgi:glutamyl-tRNA reductase
MPRDVESSAADLQNVFLYNLDDLARIAEQNRAAREAEIGKCRAILAQRADGVWSQVQRLLTRANEPGSVAPGDSGAAGQAAAH